MVVAVTWYLQDGGADKVENRMVRDATEKIIMPNYALRTAGWYRWINNLWHNMNRRACISPTRTVLSGTPPIFRN